MELEIKSQKTELSNIYTSNSFDELSEKIDVIFPGLKKVCVITDTNVSKLYLDIVKGCFNKDTKVIDYVIPAGESSKSMDEALKITELLFDNDFSREDVIFGLGGGVVSDLTGFVAGTYKRGISHAFIATTLLSMVDASIGGKTAVDFDGCKNIIGVFKSPSLIYMNISTLNTLNPREYYSGFAEVMKSALLFDAKFYEWLIEKMYEICEKDFDTVNEMIERTILIKKAIVDKDPFEKNDRVLLNLGHTIGHAIESYFKGEYLHGECVALGCVAAGFISWKMDMISMEDYYEIRDMFVPFNLPISIEVNSLQPILDLLHKDKKNTDDAVNMVLLKKIGKAVFVKNISDELIVGALDELNFNPED